MIEIIGHRGARGIEPENTMRSFRKAIELGVDYIECDVHLTKDEHIVLIHDHTLDRTTNATGNVSDYTYEEIRSLDAGKGEKIPTLQELIDLARGKVKLHIELKDEKATEQTIKLVERNNIVNQVFLTSGDTDTLRKVKGLNPLISLEHIFGQPPEDAIERALSVEAKRVSCHISHLTIEFVEEAHKNGLQVIAWPPNTLEEAKKALESSVDLICTDRPDIVTKEALANLFDIKIQKFNKY
ncbi:MAG: glycerophosphodiester phosphodiesterase [bacterium]